MKRCSGNPKIILYIASYALVAAGLPKIKRDFAEFGKIVVASSGR
jgi:hypothetical protein